MRRKKVCGISLLLIFVFLCSPGLAKPHWAQKELTKWQNNGWIRYYQKGSFDPNRYISRAEFCALANRAFGFYSPSLRSFSDVYAGSFFESDIKIGVQAGYIKGTGTNTFSPDSMIKREEVATIVSRLLMLGEENRQMATNLNDYPQVADYAKVPISQMMEKGIMKGYGNGNFGPKSYLTQAEAIVLLDRIVGEKLDIRKINPSRKSILRGNYYVDWEDPVIENVTIKGNLMLSGNLKNQQIRIINSDIQGDLLIYGGQQVVLENVRIRHARINKPTPKVTVQLEEYTDIKYTYLGGNVNIKENGDRGLGLQEVVVLEGANAQIDGFLTEMTILGGTAIETMNHTGIEKMTAKGKEKTWFKTSSQTETKEISLWGNLAIRNEGILGQVTLEGEDADLTVEKNLSHVEILKRGTLTMKKESSIQNIHVGKEANKTRLITDKDSKIGTLVIDAPTNVEGLGRIAYGRINTSGVWFEQKPDQYEVSSGVALLEKQAYMLTTEVKAERIVIRGDKTDWHRLNLKDHLQLFAEVYPEQTKIKKVNWRVIPVTGEAEINQHGVLYPLKEGAVWVQAGATDGSDIKSQELIQIVKNTEGQKIEKIVLEPEDRLKTLKPGETVAITAHIYPAGLSDQKLSWHVISHTGRGEITQSGILTAILAGEIDVAAIAQDGSGVMGTWRFNIEGTNDTIAPVLFGLSSTKVARGVEVNISSNESGKIYMVPAETPANMNAFLDRVHLKLGQVKSCAPNEVVRFSTMDLSGGKYAFYGVDRSQNISEPSPVLEVEETDQRIFIKKIEDENVYNDARDFSATFVKAKLEEKVKEYRLFIVPNDEIINYDAHSLAALDKSRFTVILPEGKSTYKHKFTQDTIDASGHALVHGKVYRILGLTMAKDLSVDVNQLSLPSDVLIPNFKDESVPDTVAPVIVYLKKEGKELVLKVNENSMFYFVPADTEGTIEKIKEAISEGKGLAKKVQENQEATMDTGNLKNGLYVGYGVDDFDNLSAPSVLIEIQNIRNAAEIHSISDLNLHNDATDISIVFEKAPDESNVKAYHIVAVPKNLASLFDKEAAALLDQNLKQWVEKEGKPQYTQVLGKAFLDITRSPLTHDKTYVIYVFTESLDGKGDELSLGKDFTPNFEDTTTVLQLEDLDKTYLVAGGVIKVKASTKGVVYMVPAAVQQNYESILQAAANPASAKAVQTEGQETCEIQTMGLSEGIYRLILADEYHNLSAPSDKIYVAGIENRSTITNMEATTGTGGEAQTKVTFGAVPDESKILRYGILWIPQEVGPLSYEEMIEISESYMSLVDKGALSEYSQEFEDANGKDYQGKALEKGKTYRVYVVSIPEGSNAVVKQISEAKSYTMP